jgi:hypothetical protein
MRALCEWHPDKPWIPEAAEGGTTIHSRRPRPHSLPFFSRGLAVSSGAPWTEA